MIKKRPKKDLPSRATITIFGEFDYEKTNRFVRMFKKQGYMSLWNVVEYEEETIKTLNFEHYQYYEEGCLPDRLKEILLFLFEKDFFIYENNENTNACIDYIEVMVFSKEVLEEKWEFWQNKVGLYYDREYWYYDQYSDGKRENFLEMSEVGYIFKK